MDDYQEQIAYNGQGQWEEFSSRERNEAGEWEFVRREQLTYDNQGNPQKLVVAKGNGNTWEPSMRLEATFNEEGFYTQIFRQMWSGATWDTLAIETATFDPENEIWHGYLLEERNETTGEFENVNREAYLYNRRGYWVKTLRQAWDINTETWVNAFRNLAKFDENKNLQREIGTQLWDVNQEGWAQLSDTRSCIHNWSKLTVTAINNPIPNLNCAIANPYTLRTPIRCESLELGKNYQVELKSNIILLRS